ncbi:MAG: glycosyltransferase family 4 protein [Chloroflexi bacterium]|nr:glycosyltransferase family 4 protein [Chloroflexota bacterium]MBT3670565.1 glycosyltransferase family 4 protein [Chloroflexota bacterium]MBT4533441.1 glycosyltransferase family 4 protein [Chloroflexota bacterium]MBT4683602.1 glycosyltransferase family 4 protein [Chloroflexota bacterium]MBT4755207.1 glycosyltransferase family 4 protein [Chloroflexota bacterium]
MAERGIEVTYDLDDHPYDVVLVSGGLRSPGKLKTAAKKNIPIVQRLDGINWVHKRSKTGLKHYLKSEYGNLIISYLRDRVVNKIIYQSEFVLKNWERVYGSAKVPHVVVHNGVDLTRYTPDGPHDRTDSPYKIALVEGGFGNGHEYGIETLVRLIEELTSKHELKVEAHIAGRVPETVKKYWEENSDVQMIWAGFIDAEEIPKFNRSAHLFFSAELNAACPNSVIEALACGLPVLAYDTGSLSELVQKDAGQIVPFEGDPWKKSTPNISKLAESAVEIFENQEKYRSGARMWAEEALGLENMLDNYLDAIRS